MEILGSQPERRGDILRIRRDDWRLEKSEGVPAGRARERAKHTAASARILVTPLIGFITKLAKKLKYEKSERIPLGLQCLRCVRERGIAATEVVRKRMMLSSLVLEAGSVSAKQTRISLATP